MILRQLIAGLDLTIGSGPVDMPLTDVTDDSRRVTAGALFVARGGVKEDGARYIADALARGAAAVLAGAATAPPADLPVTVAWVRAAGAQVDQRLAGQVAEKFFNHPSGRLRLAGITGTKGKTTVAFVLQQLLGAAGVKAGLIGTVVLDDGNRRVDAELTTPGAIDLSRWLAAMVGHGCGAAVAEFSSHAIHQGRIAALSPQAAIYTNLSGDHLDYHGTMEEYAAAKALLFAGLSPDAAAIINLDDPWSPRMGRDCRAGVWGCTLQAQGDPPTTAAVAAIHVDGKSILRGIVRAHITELGAARSVAEFTGPWGRFVAAIPLVGKHNVMNALQAATAAWCMTQAGADVLQKALETCAPPPGRLEPVTLPESTPASYPTVLVDYAHTDDPLAKTLESLRPLLPAGGRLLCLFGCGGDRDRTKRPRMAAAACRLADQVIITSDNPRTENPQTIIDEILAGVPADTVIARLPVGVIPQIAPPLPKVMVQPDRAAAIALAVATAGARDVVLLAGKGHETYQIIGKTKHPFDDRVVAATALQDWVRAHPATASAKKAPPAQVASFWKVDALAQALSAGRWLLPPREAGGAASVGGVSTDSRSVTAGQVFVALPGERFDGHDFLAQVAQRRPAMIVVSDETKARTALGAVKDPPPVYLVPDTVAALQDWAKAYRQVLRQVGTRVIAVIGSNGKTTTRHLIHTVLAASFRGTQSPKSFNNHLGVPLTLLASPGDDFVVVEAGTNHPGEIAALLPMVQPDALVLTSLGREHMEFFQTLAGVAAEECSAFSWLAPGGLAVLPADEPAAELLTPHLPQLPPGSVVVHTGTATTAAACLIGAQPTRTGLHARAWLPLFTTKTTGAPTPDWHPGLPHPGLQPGAEWEFTLPLPGRHNALNALNAAVVGAWMGLTPGVIAQALAAAQPAPQRGEIVTVAVEGGQVSVINDAYNANPDSMAAALAMLVEEVGESTDDHTESGPKGLGVTPKGHGVGYGVTTDAPARGRRIAVLGDMLELGEQSPDLHRQVGRTVARLGQSIDQVILIGPMAMFMAQALLKEGYPAPQVATFASWSDDLPMKVRCLWRPGDIVLLKASRGMRLERLLAK